MMKCSGQTRQLLDRLRLDGDVDVVVDVSNVCKDREIGTGWVNLLTMLDAIRRYLDVARVHAILVLDESLLLGTGNNPLPARERGIIQLIVDECEALDEASPFHVVRYADDEILAQAFRHRARVVANDRYREHYRDHAWLKEGSGRFLGWSCRGGRVTVTAVRRIDTGVWTDSRAQQSAKLDGLPEYARRELFSWWLTCGNSVCSRYRRRLVFGVPGGARWAHYRKTFVCQVCSVPALRDGPRPAGCDVYVIWGRDRHVATYLVPEGESLTLGSGPEPDIDVFCEPAAAGPDLLRPSPKQRARVDAVHCRVACEDGKLTVTDLGSQYGTCVQRMRHSKLADVDALTPGTPVKLWHGDTAMLGEVVRLRTSGKPLPHGFPMSAA
jgi:hypothetical protein